MPVNEQYLSVYSFYDYYDDQYDGETLQASSPDRTYDGGQVYYDPVWTPLNIEATAWSN